MNNKVELLGTYGDDETIALSAWTSTSRDMKDRYSFSGVYSIINKKNEKMYIGSSYNIYKRVQKHLSDMEKNKHINHHLMSSFKIYGIENFKVSILCECDKLDLLIFEDYYINKYQSYINKNGYNQTTTSYSPLGYCHTQESKEVMRMKKLGRKLTQDHVNKIIGSRKGYKHSEETKNKISIKNSGSNNGMYGIKENEDHKKIRMLNFLNATKWNKGKNKHNDEKMKLISEKLKGRKVHNSLKCRLSDTETGEVYESNSLKELSDICKVPLITISRIKNNTCGLKMKSRYRLEVL